MLILRRHPSHGSLRLALLAALVLAALLSSPSLHADAHDEGDPLKDNPRQWAVEAARFELSVIDHKGTLLRYRLHIVDAKGDMLRDTIESKDGSVHRLIYRDGHALTADEDRDERERLQAELDSPSDFARHIKSEQSGKKMAGELIKLLPEAMLYTYVPGQPQRAGVARDEHPDVVLDFKPNPAWTPPNMTAEALTGIEGRMWIDRGTHRLTRFEGTIFKPINLGLGVLAHVFPGGKLSVEQVPFNDRWIVSHFTQKFVVRALMVKTMHENSQVDASDVQQVNPMTYQDAIRTLLATPLPH